MKKYILVVIALLINNVNTQAQFLKNMMAGGSNEKYISLRGPVQPLDGTYKNSKTFSLKLNIDPSFESSVSAKKIPYSLNDLSEPLNIFGLKKVDNGNFKIIYNLKRYELVEDDYVEKDYQNAPAYYVGLESNLEIQDKDGKVIYKRYSTPKVKMFVTDPGYGYEKLAYGIVRADFRNLIDEFETYYLYSPNIKLEYFDVKKKKKSKSTFNVEEFNQSSQVFAALIDVDRENWAGLFGEAEKYWKTLREFTDEDEDLQKDIRFTSNYNLACTAILMGKMEELDAIFANVKENEKGFLGVRTNYDALVRTKKNIEEAKNEVQQVAQIQPIEAEPIIAEYRKGKNAFHYAEIEGGEALDQDNNSYKGNVRIMSDSPELIDLRTTKTRSGLGQLMDQMGSDKSTVRIYIEGEKKPKKANLKKLVFIKDKTGKIYITGKTGGGASLLTSSRNIVNTKRYALFEEVKTTKKLALFQEFFPQDSYVLKRSTEEEFFSPPAFLGRRKALREYFADCPAMLPKIDKGEYDFNTKETYLKMYNDYFEADCGK